MNNRTRVATLSATNFKGSTFTHRLAPVTLFHGRNAAGKSSRIEALTLALLGYLPGVGKKGSDLFARLSSGAAMGVGVDFDNPAFNGGQGVGRRWREAKGSVKYEGSGDALDFPAVALDPDEFLGLSGPEQVKALFRAVQLPPGMTVDALCRRAADAVDKADVEGDHSIRRPIQQELADWVTNFKPDDWDQTLQSLVDALVAEAGLKKRLATQSVQRMEKTLQGLAMTPASAPADPECESKLAAARAVLLGLEKELAAKEQAGRTAKAALDETARLAAQAVDETEARAELAAIEAGKADIGKRCLAGPPDVDAAVNAHHEAFVKAKQASDRSSDYARRVQSAEAKLAAAKQDKVCPHCGQSVVELKKDLVAKLEAELLAILAEPQEDAAPLMAVVAETEKAKQAAFEARRDYDRDQSQFRALSERHAAILAKLDGNAKAAEAKAAVPGLEQQLAALRADYSFTKTQAEEARASVTALETAYSQLLAQRADDRRRAEAAGELEKARVYERCCKSLKEVLDQEQRDMVSTCVKPLVEGASVLFRAIRGEALSYRDGEIGIQRGGAFWSHRSFSGTEKALFHAGVSFALAKAAPVRIVVLDELGRLDRKNKAALITALLRMIAEGQIDQAILADTEPVGATVEPPGVYQEINVN